MVNGDYSQNNQGVANNFNPDILIQVEEQVTYNNVTVQVERDEETQYTYSTVIVEKTPEVIKLEKGKNPVVMVIPIALSIVMVFIGVVACRYIKNKSDANLHLAQARVERAKAFENGQVSPHSVDGKGYKDVLGEKEMANLAQLGHKLGGGKLGDDLGD